jgi:hypothetical protein
MYYFYISGENRASPSSTTKNNPAPTINSRHQQHEGISKVTLEYLNQLLLQYSNDSRQTASDIVGGFKDAIDDIEDLNMDDMDEAYNMLYQNLMTMQPFQGIQSRLAAITLAKFFLEKFQYLPTPSIPLIQSSEATNSHPNSLPKSRSSSIDTNEVSQPRTQSSPVSTNTTQIRTQQSPAPSNNLESSTASARIRSRGASPKDARIELPRDTNAANLAVVAIHNQAAAVNAMNIHSLPSNLSAAEILYRQRQQYAAQMAMANAAAAAGVHLPVNTSGNQIAHTVNSHRLPTTPQQQLTIYGPNGQPGIHTQFPTAMVGTAGATNSTHQTVRAILPRTPIPTASATQLASARHNLPLQVQPQRHPFP